jgi:CheY-like chemotaxis protein
MAKVLLVEDDNNLREIYQARLAAEGYEISSAQDGEEALVVAKQEKPDLVISDVMMPKISGFEMLDILRNTAGLEHVKVIMLTALGQSEDRDRADSLGADKYLVKSQVTLEDIVKTAHTLLEGDAEAPAAVAAATAAPATTPDPAATPAVTDDSAAVANPPAANDTATPAPADPVATPPEESAVPAETPVEPAPAPDGSVAQEEAVVQDQINSFVESTPAEPPAEAPADPVATPPEESATENVTPAAEPVAAPEAPAESSLPASGDDKLMAAAANELASSAGTDVAEVATPAEPVAAPEAPAEEEAPKEPENPDISTTTISGKKVIKPLDSEPKPDIHELLAKEEATETTATGPVVTSDPAAPTQAPEEKKPGDGPDPNSIAL